MSRSLISTKIHVPPYRSSIVTRPRLIERLNEGKREKLTLISASAGFGKTTLLSEWSHQCEGHVAWLALDEGDNDPVRFWTYFIAALQTQIATPGQSSLAMLQSAQMPSIPMLLTSLINDLSNLGEDILLVLDDYHVIEEKAVHEGMMFLLEHLPASLHLYMAGRIDPPLPLARLRVRERIIEIRDTHLRFTQDEAITFLEQSMNIQLSRNDAEALEARTEGWIAGLQLAAVSLQNRSNVSERVQSFTGSNRFILDYLIDEVLHRQPQHIQQFLLQTSLLRRFNASLCEAITGREDCQQLLELLEHRNLFIIPLDDERQWYRYHALFGDVLQARLLVTQREKIPALHVRAAQWFEQHSSNVDAIHHALTAKSYPYAAQLIEDSIESIWKSGELTTFIGWVQVLPEELVRSRLWLCSIYAWVLFLTIHTETALRYMHYIEQELTCVDANNNKPEYRDIRGMLAAIQGTIAVMKGGHEQGIELSHQALEQLAQEKQFWRLMPSINLGFAHQATGDFIEAERAFSEARRAALTSNNLYFALVATNGLASAQMYQAKLLDAMSSYQQAQALESRMGGQLPVSGYIRLGVGLIACELNNQELAIHTIQQAIEQGSQWPVADIVMYGHVSLAYALLFQHDIDGARKSWQRAHAITNKVGSELDKLEVTALQVRLWLAEGNYAEAYEWASQWSEWAIAPKHINYRHEVGHLSYVRTCLIQKQYQVVLELLTSLLSIAEQQQRVRSCIEILVLQAVTLESSLNLPQALKSLIRALALSKQEGYIRVYVAEGEPMLRMLTALHAAWQKHPQQDSYALTAYVTTLIQSFDSPKNKVTVPTGNSSLIEPLSERELEVLHMLVNGASNQEIAESLVVTLSTIKKHVGNILAKLSVASRTQAIVRASELQIV